MEPGRPGRVRSWRPVVHGNNYLLIVGIFLGPKLGPMFGPSNLLAIFERVMGHMQAQLKIEQK